jgi:hypothetical protein
MNARLRLPLTFVLWVTIGCNGGTSSEDDEGDGKSDQIGACSIIDKSGGQAGRLGKLNDPVADKILRGGAKCPTSFEAIQATLRKTDAEACEGEAKGIGKGNFYHVVSETSQITGKPGDYRVVLGRRCGGRQEGELLMSLFATVDGPIEDDVELIGFSPTNKSSGVFNYYKLIDGQWNFFGNSEDFVTKGPGAGGERDCARCHQAGGLIMKELHAPWSHWHTGFVSIPGVIEGTFENNHPVVGNMSNGETLEKDVVEPMNQMWNVRRAKLWLSQLDPNDVTTTQRLLEPLFCTVDMNLETSTGTVMSFDGPSTHIFGEGLINLPNVEGFSSQHYRELLDEVDQRIEGVDGVDGVDGVVRDGPDTFIFPRKADIDVDYILELRRTGVIDDELMTDVMMVDYTRAIYSDDRCNILKEFAPPLTKTQATAQGIRQAFIESLASAKFGSPGGKLLTALKRDGDRGRVDTMVAKYETACKARLANDGKALLRDLMMITAINRNLVKGTEPPRGRLFNLVNDIIEFPQTIPVSKLDAEVMGKRMRLNPETCLLEEK